MGYSPGGRKRVGHNLVTEREHNLEKQPWRIGKAVHRALMRQQELKPLGSSRRLHRTHLRVVH